LQNIGHHYSHQVIEMFRSSSLVLAKGEVLFRRGSVGCNTTALLADTEIFTNMEPRGGGRPQLVFLRAVCSEYGTEEIMLRSGKAQSAIANDGDDLWFETGKYGIIKFCL